MFKMLLPWLVIKYNPGVLLLVANMWTNQHTVLQYFDVKEQMQQSQCKLNHMIVNHAFSSF